MSNKLPELQLPSDMQHDTSQHEELRAASVMFLGNVKARFGEQSFQVFEVTKGLNRFHKGFLSKRETHKTILDTLDGHDDLRQELMDILVHPAARWGPNDFDLPTQHLTQTPMETSPLYLQPTHEPQIRLPSFSGWCSGAQSEHFASLPTLNGYDSSGERSVVPPSSLLPPPFPMSEPTTHLRLDADANASHLSFHGHNHVMPPVQMTFRNPWEDSKHPGDWTDDEINFLADATILEACFKDQQLPNSLVQDRQEAALPHTHHTDSYTMPMWFQQTTPYAVTTTRHIPSPVDDDSLYTTRAAEQPVPSHTPPTPNSQSPSGDSSTEVLPETADVGVSSAVDRSLFLDRPFVHNLCGKAFSTLAGVRKHHWGKKVRDLNTTTGCWAKQKKPNVAWDDHPSCKDGPPTTTVTKTLSPTSQQKQTKSFLLQSTMTSVDEGPCFRSLPGFPTLEYLPQTVAKAVNAGIATDSSAQEPGMIDQTPLIATSRRSFDTLLTAVNAVSRIDAPKPKSRVDSIARTLDAQVAAAEQPRHSISNDTFTSSLNLMRYRTIAPAALSIVGGPSMEGFSNNSSGHRTGSVHEGETSVFTSDVEASLVAGALSRPLQPHVASSSGPARKKRKV